MKNHEQNFQNPRRDPKIKLFLEQSESEDQEDFVLTAEKSTTAPTTEISTTASMTSPTTEMTSSSTAMTSSMVITMENKDEAEEEKETTPSRILQFTIDEEEMTSPVVIEMTSPAVEMTSQETEATTTEQTTTVRITTTEEDEGWFQRNLNNFTFHLTVRMPVV